MARSRLAVVAVVVVCGLLVGCAAKTAMMMPVAGPLSERRPVPVLTVRIGGTGYSGNLSFEMPDGDQCEGRWASAGGSGTTITTGLLGEFGPIYLASMSVGEGQNPGQALIACNTGRTMEIEFVTGAGTASGFGIGKDNEDNIYRLVF